MKRIAQIFAFIAFFSSVACAETPSAPVDPVVEAQGIVSLSAVEYTGRSAASGKGCNLYIGHDHQDGALLVKVDTLVHGEAPSDGESQFYKFDDRTQKYLDKGSKNPDAFPALVSIQMMDEDVEGDVNKIADYERNGEVRQWLRIEFDDMNINDYMETLELVTDDPKKFAANEDALDQVSFVVGKIEHSGHLDSFSCRRFQPKGVKSVEFNLDADHGHDHGHTH